jgi:low temperature requirement protein LtrA
METLASMLSRPSFLAALTNFGTATYWVFFGKEEPHTPENTARDTLVWASPIIASTIISAVQLLYLAASHTSKDSSQE